MIGYDKIVEHEDILLDLPFYEASGVLTHDQAKPHHQPVTLINTPTWETIGSGLCVLTFDGVNERFELAGANCADLDFIGGDYSLCAWLN